MKKTLIFSAVALAGALLIVAPSEAQRRANVTDLKGKPMPDFTTRSLEGKTITKQSLRGKVVVMDFWATWCGPCRAASPRVQQMHMDWKDKGVVVLGMNTWERNDRNGDNARKYVKEHGYTFTQTFNNDEFARRIGVQGLPTFIVMDKRGVVREVTVGFNERAIRAAVDALIK